MARCSDKFAKQINKAIKQSNTPGKHVTYNTTDEFICHLEELYIKHYVKVYLRELINQSILKDIKSIDGIIDELCGHLKEEIYKIKKRKENDKRKDCERGKSS